MVTTEEVKDRLVTYLDFKKIKFGTLERKVGLANGYIKNNRGGFSGAKLGSIIKEYDDLNGDWLLTGRGEMIYVAPEQRPVTNINQGEHATGSNFAGHDVIINEKKEISEEIIEADVDSIDNWTHEKLKKEYLELLRDYHKLSRKLL